ncbi:maleylpyruvate isomerase N-terminal domain-containing protein [Agromyces bauzanensis]|uniref:Mycothiol-dependent maleylpyruvate isomerase metal-binding domain-containing protein n=1 Tax=Agromyces bauzanensis TaxID=1308924 RepID=A0A917PLN4_9MICO|nr:maleylpyruvate isomerase N-terminal domain-containing protein [Agromyces bauzanensis]GGJ82984.1 hypothetical protein GCM10011372_21590 [Agromyces bauzanensis]
MNHLSDLRGISRAFASDAASIDPEAAVRSEIWPTAGRIIDHLGNIQRWVTEIVRTGMPQDRREFRRPAELDRIGWFVDVNAHLVAELESNDPARPCWALYDTSGDVAFWRRRMAHEAGKHLWDLRTAREQAPPLPAEISVEGRGDIIDEFGDVFMAQARRRGIEPLPAPVDLVADDTSRRWRVSPTWGLRSDVAGATSDATSVEAPGVTVTGSVGDLVLFIWGRADPLALPGRFSIDGDDRVFRAFRDTPVHL